MGARGVPGDRRVRAPKNQATRQEAQKIYRDTRMTPKQWERCVAALLKVNGWQFHHERDRAGGAATNSRKAGFPDYICYKEFSSNLILPPRLAEVTGVVNWMIGEDVDVEREPITIFGFIECKSGRGQPTAAQLRWIDNASRCPGMFACIVWPPDRAWLVTVLGGVEVVR